MSDTTAALLAQRCAPLPAGTPALGSDAVRSLLKAVPGWSAATGAISRTWRFANHYEAIAFVNAVAWVSHREDHHPDMTVGYNEVTVTYSTHSVGGLSINDFICAARLDALG